MCYINVYSKTSLIPDLIYDKINDDFGSEDDDWEEQKPDPKKKRGRQTKIKEDYDGELRFKNHYES